MSKNANLGKYDMVLALSENKINSQFKEMYKRNIIKKDWQFLTSIDGENTLGKDNKNFNTDLNDWKEAGNKKASLIKKKGELTDLQKRIDDLEDKADKAEDEGRDDDAKKDKTKRRELRKNRKVLEKTISELESGIEKLRKFDVLLDGKIKCPKIEIISNTPKSLFFNIEFDYGSNLVYKKEDKTENISLDNYNYAFRVPVGNIRITDKEKILIVQGKDNQLCEKEIRDTGISDNDFTIDSLFLDFSNANIADYDGNKSKLPEDAKAKTNLQIAIVNYFKNPDNKYILGYAINKKEVKVLDKALLQPTGASYSTSFSNIKRATAFNFLMLLNNHSFPTGNSTGVLDKSLIEKVEDTTKTVHGVFGVDFIQFKENFIPQLTDGIKNDFYESLRKKWGSTTFKRKTQINEDTTSIKLTPSIGSYPTIKQSRIDGVGVLTIKYPITANGNVHKEVETFGIKDPITGLEVSTGTIGMDWELSTSGEHKLQHNIGKKGSIEVVIKPSSKGKFEYSISYLPPTIGAIKEKPETEDGFDKYVKRFMDSVDSIMKFIGSSKLFDTDSINFDVNSITSTLDLDEIANLNNKIILPVSQTYTYKNIRLLNGSQSENDAVLFDISYAPIQ